MVGHRCFFALLQVDLWSRLSSCYPVFFLRAFSELTLSAIGLSGNREWSSCHKFGWILGGSCQSRSKGGWGTARLIENSCKFFAIHHLGVLYTWIRTYWFYQHPRLMSPCLFYLFNDTTDVFQIAVAGFGNAQEDWLILNLWLLLSWGYVEGSKWGLRGLSVCRNVFLMELLQGVSSAVVPWACGQSQPLAMIWITPLFITMSMWVILSHCPVDCFL